MITDKRLRPTRVNCEYFVLNTPVTGVELQTCYVPIVLLQLVGLDPLVAALLVDMNFVVIGTDGEFCKKTQRMTNKEEKQRNETVTA